MLIKCTIINYPYLSHSKLPLTAYLSRKKTIIGVYAIEPIPATAPTIPLIKVRYLWKREFTYTMVGENIRPVPTPSGGDGTKLKSHIYTIQDICAFNE